MPFYSNLPQEVQDELMSYVAGKHPWPFGSFLTAVLANDFIGAVGRADTSNLRLLQDYAWFLANNMPGRTGDARYDYWGSYEAVEHRITDQITAAVTANEHQLGNS